MSAAVGAVAAVAAAATAATAARRRSNPAAGTAVAMHSSSPMAARPKPELRHAVEDLDRPPAPREGGGADRQMHVGRDFPPVSEEDADAMAPPFDREPEAAPAKAAPAEPEPSPEPPRRRSTVREPAPFAVEAAPPSPTLPPPTPVISSTAAMNRQRPSAAGGPSA